MAKSHHREEAHILKAITILGIVLIVGGLAALVVKGVQYTTHDTVIDAGPVQVEAKQKETIPLSPIVGGVALVSGLIPVGVGRRN